ncbi:MAG: hypothetical protein J3K34DRAFT_525315 [Monoraphidium minutum]|nr:MAG: hypothetical protein J3K34DRAFT_525315 [Monoraphidium minutum]
MAQVVRRIVSGQKKRFSSHGFDLDLAYIAPRLVAMGLPATGSEGLYRNPLAETARFLSRFHGGRCKVWNLCSERLYDPSKIAAPVVQGRFAFDDHQARGAAPMCLSVPPLPMAQLFCEEAAAWLAAHPENVAVVHCKAGKGRTGLMLCCLLLHLHVTDPSLANFPDAALVHPLPDAGAGDAGAAGGGGGKNGGARGAGLWWRRELQRELAVDVSSLDSPAADVLALYAARRTHDGKGVTIASQRRWVEYFWRALSERIAGGGGGGWEAAAGRPVRVRRLRVCGLPPGGAAGCTVTVALRPEWRPPPPPPAGGGAGAAASGPEACQAAWQGCSTPQAVAVAAFSAGAAAGGGGGGGGAACSGGGWDCVAPCRGAPAVKDHSGGGRRGGGAAAAWDEGCDATVVIGGGVAGDELDVTFPPGCLPLLAPQRRGGGGAAAPAASGSCDLDAAPRSALLLRGDVRVQISRGPGAPPGGRVAHAWFNTGFLPRGAAPAAAGGGGGGRCVLRLGRDNLDKVSKWAPPGLRLEIEYEEAVPLPGGGGAPAAAEGGEPSAGGGGGGGARRGQVPPQRRQQPPAQQQAQGQQREQQGQQAQGPGGQQLSVAAAPLRPRPWTAPAAAPGAPAPATRPLLAAPPLPSALALPQLGTLLQQRAPPAAPPAAAGAAQRPAQGRVAGGGLLIELPSLGAQRQAQRLAAGGGGGAAGSVSDELALLLSRLDDFAAPRGGAPPAAAPAPLPRPRSAGAWPALAGAAVRSSASAPGSPARRGGRGVGAPPPALSAISAPTSPVTAAAAPPAPAAEPPPAAPSAAAADAAAAVASAPAGAPSAGAGKPWAPRRSRAEPKVSAAPFGAAARWLEDDAAPLLDTLPARSTPPPPTAARQPRAGWRGGGSVRAAAAAWPPRQAAALPPPPAPRAASAPQVGSSGAAQPSAGAVFELWRLFDSAWTGLRA